MFELVETGAGVHQQDPRARILVDLREQGFDPVALALLSHHAGQNFRAIAGARIAVLVSHPTWQGQRIARQQGLDLRVFGRDEQDFAEEWLSEP